MQLLFDFKSSPAASEFSYVLMNNYKFKVKFLEYFPESSQDMPQNFVQSLVVCQIIRHGCQQL